MSIVLTGEQAAKQLSGLAEQLAEPGNAGLRQGGGLAHPLDHLLGFDDEVERGVEPGERDHVVGQESSRPHSIH